MRACSHVYTQAVNKLQPLTLVLAFLKHFFSLLYFKQALTLLRFVVFWVSLKRVRSHFVFHCFVSCCFCFLSDMDFLQVVFCCGLTAHSCVNNPSHKNVVKETTGVCRQWQNLVNCLTCLWLDLFCYFLRLMTFPVVSFSMKGCNMHPLCINFELYS